MGGVVGPKSTREVREFLAESTGLMIDGCRFERSPDGNLVLVVEYKDFATAETRTKRLAIAARHLTPFEQVTDLAVMMSEVLGLNDNRMLELIGVQGHG